MSGHTIQTGCRILALALLPLGSLTPTAKAKVIWNDPISLSARGSDGACRAAPLDRAERLAWRQNFFVRRAGNSFVPPLVTPFAVWLPFVQTGWMWSSRPLGVFGPFCDR